ncbi:MAG: phosphatase PAP2 family protein [Candidatus Pacearchaeota archaeon]|jgi:undecaprenyl-diphosphatase|nr:hypothetical protein [Candidatus Pacearchaeota archaeon]MDP7520712.1 phosphatase PAP2 family protein [Candidatus Pacearchaeota archaeon]|tara:strand:- start:5825 stop:6442 length:618 start_codon:yes stop_codon:yes gene_type:complete
MKKKQVVFIGIIIFFLTLFSLYFDSEIVKGVSSIRTAFLDDFFIGITYLSSKLVIFLFLTMLFVLRYNKRKWILPIWFTLFLSAVISFLLKFSIQRPRPFQLGIISLLPSLEKASHLIWNFSFPSSHAMIIFCTIPFISRKFPRFKYIWIISALLVAFSRVYFGLHFLSDVIVGGLIGYLIGIIVIKQEKENKFWEKIYNKISRR